MRRLCLGKKPPLVDVRTLEFARYLKPSLPPPPDSIDYGKAVARWPMYANDRFGDCTCAAAGHMIQNWRTNTGISPRKPTTKDVIDFYSYFTKPGADNGVEMLRVLQHWRSAGLDSNKIVAYTKLQLKNIDAVKQSIYLFGACYIGVELPEFVTSASDISRPRWAMRATGTKGPGSPDPDGGHCIPAFGYDAKNVHVVTWGKVKSMSWDFYQAYSDEAYAVLSEDFLKDGKTLEGFDLKQLNADLGSL